MKKLLFLFALFFIHSSRAEETVVPAPVDRTDKMKRWNSLTDAQKAELRKRYEKFKSATPEQQALLKRRLANLQRATGKGDGHAPGAPAEAPKPKRAGKSRHATVDYEEPAKTGLNKEPGKNIKGTGPFDPENRQGEGLQPTNGSRE